MLRHLSTLANALLFVDVVAYCTAKLEFFIRIVVNGKTVDLQYRDYQAQNAVNRLGRIFGQTVIFEYKRKELFKALGMSGNEHLMGKNGDVGIAYRAFEDDAREKGILAALAKAVVTVLTVKQQYLSRLQTIFAVSFANVEISTVKIEYLASSRFS